MRLYDLVHKYNENNEGFKYICFGENNSLYFVNIEDGYHVYRLTCEEICNLLRDEFIFVEQTDTNYEEYYKKLRCEFVDEMDAYQFHLCNENYLWTNDKEFCIEVIKYCVNTYEKYGLL